MEKADKEIVVKLYFRTFREDVSDQESIDIARRVTELVREHLGDSFYFSYWVQESFVSSDADE